MFYRSEKDPMLADVVTGKLDITPWDMEVDRLAGYTGREDGVSGVLGPLSVRGWIARDSTGRVLAWIAFDALSVSNNRAQAVSKVVTEAFPAAISVVTASHTHSAPSDSAWWDHAIEQAEALVNLLAAEMDKAPERCRLAVLESSCSIGFNRRLELEDGTFDLEPNPDGHRLGYMTSIGWASEKGVLCGASILPVHSTCLGPVSRAISGDLAGAFSEHVERFARGAWISAMGGGGNQCPNPRSTREPVFGRSHWDLAARLAQEASAAHWRPLAPKFANYKSAVNLEQGVYATLHAVGLARDTVLACVDGETYSDTVERAGVPIVDVAGGNSAGYIVPDYVFEQGDSYTQRETKHGPGGEENLLAAIEKVKGELLW